MIKILLVEDLATDAELIERELIQAKLHFTILTVQSSREYREALHDFSPDIILADHSLPSFSSHEALDILKAESLKIPFILITGNISEQFSLGIVDRGADDYVLKDRLERLPVAVKNLLEKFRLEKERLVYFEELRRNEQRSRSLIENIADVISIINDSGSISYCSPAISLVLGYKREEAIEQNIIDIVHPDDKSHLVNAIAHAKDKDRVPHSTGTIRLRHKNSSWKSVKGTLTNLSSDRSIAGILYTFRDITLQRASEALRKKSESQHRQLFQFNPVPNFVFDAQTFSILDINLSAIDLYGYSRAEFLAMTLEDLTDKSDFTKKLRDVVAGAKHPSAKARSKPIKQRRKDGRILKVEISCYWLDFEGARAMLATMMDVTKREEALTQLRLNEKRLLVAQKIASLGYWQLNVADKSMYWSNEVYNIWEMQRELTTPTFKSFAKMVHPDDREALLTRQKAAIDHGAEFDIEYRLLLPEGKMKWVHDRCEVVKDDQNKTILLEGTVQDITAKQLALEELAISEARHRGILNSQANYVIRTDLEGRYTYVSKSFSRDFAFSFPGEQIIGRSSLEFMMPYHHQAVKETVQKCLESPNEIFQVEIDKIKKGGGVKTTFWDFVCLTDGKGNPREIQCAGIDISDRISAEKALKESLTRYDFVLKATSDAIWDWDVIADTMFWGDGIFTLFGHPASGKSSVSTFWTDHIHPEDAVRVSDSIKAFLLGDEPHWDEEYRFKKSDGQYAYVRDRGFVIRDTNGKALRMVGSLADITEQKKGEIKLRDLNQQLNSYMSELVTTNKELEQFSYIVSHNLRAPVANIIGLSDLLSSPQATAQEKEELLPEILQAGKRLDEVIGDINQILEIKGKVQEHTVLLSLEEIVSSVRLDLGEKVKNSNALIFVDFSRCDDVFGIRSYIFSILHNLISNAIKYAQPGVAPKITILSDLVDEKIIITVKDNGLGIDLENKGEQVFGLYKRFHYHTEGKGMGLFMVKTQIESLGGKIYVSSEVGKGSTFTIILPKLNV